STADLCGDNVGTDSTIDAWRVCSTIAASVGCRFCDMHDADDCHSAGMHNGAREPSTLLEIRMSSLMMPAVNRGACHSIFVHDIAFSIDLNEAERRMTSATRETIKHKRRAPPYFEYSPAPLRFTRSTEPVRIDARFATASLVDLVIYDF